MGCSRCRCRHNGCGWLRRHERMRRQGSDDTPIVLPGFIFQHTARKRDRRDVTRPTAVKHTISSARKTWSRHKTCQLRLTSRAPVAKMNVAHHSSCSVLYTVDYRLPAKYRRCLSQAGGSPSEGSKGARGTGFRMTTMRARVCEGDDKRHTSRRPAPSPHERPLCILSARAARHLLVVMLA
jgi:hypothetical protein